MYGGARAFDSGLIEEDPALFSCAGSAGASVHGDWELQDCRTRTVEQGLCEHPVEIAWDFLAYLR